MSSPREGVESEEKGVQRQSPEEYLFVKRQQSVGEATRGGAEGIPGGSGSVINAA